MPARSFALLLLFLSSVAFALQPSQKSSSQPVHRAAPPPVHVLTLSDIHFDPFHDPGKVQQLRSEPIEHWPAIFSTPPTATQAADLQKIQSSCNARSLDTDWSLLQTTFTATHDAEAHPAFVTLSGDLLTHDFPCRFQNAVPEGSAEDLAAFAAKTVSFVLAQTRAAYPRVPVFGSLGNNDSGCADYRETPADSFLQTSSAALAAAAGVDPATVSPEGDYSVLLPAPMQHTRLLVLEDTFEARQFSPCTATATGDRAPEKAQLEWLQAQLTSAHQHGEQVWVMAHVPPGVDVYTSFRSYLFKPSALCSAEPRPFLADTGLADALLDHADIIRFALFGHTHMDEFRLLRRDSSDSRAPGGPAIPAKVVPSVTPFFGNHPAFLVVTVDPHTAVVRDWRTVVSPGPQGSSAPWTDAYRYSEAYHLPDFSAASAAKLADSFTADPLGQAANSSTFREHFYAGDPGLYALGLAQIWPAYSCAVRENRPSAVHSCLCAALPPEQPAP